VTVSVNCQFNKKLSYRKEAALCAVSLKILLLLKVTEAHLNVHY